MVFKVVSNKPEIRDTTTAFGIYYRIIYFGLASGLWLREDETDDGVIDPFYLQLEWRDASLRVDLIEN